MTGRVLAAAELLLRFLRAVVVSGLQTVRAIAAATLPGAPAPPSALLRFRFAPMSERGAALLGALVSLTPGTTTIEIDMERRELLVHVLDASDPAGLAAAIRRDLERPLATLFGTGAP